jgi:hypothetical protein
MPRLAKAWAGGGAVGAGQNRARPTVEPGGKSAVPGANAGGKGEEVRK